MSTSTIKYNIGRYAVDLVAAMGPTHVFTLTGGMAMHLNRAVAQHPTLKAVYCQHEQACVAAAEGYSKASNFRHLGFAVVTAGPGASNTVTSLISAYGDSTPMVVLAGQIKTADIDSYGTRTHGIQEIHSREVISPCVKHFVCLDDENFKNQLAEACIIALSGRPGPVFVEIPLDVQGLPIESSVQEIDAAAALIHETARLANLEASHGAEIEEALTALLKAHRPLLYVGNGVRISGQESSVKAFAERHQIPMVFSWLSFDIISGDHPLYFGSPGGLAPIYSNQILSLADTIVFLGARLDLGTTAFQRDIFGGQASRWIVDVDPAELSKFTAMAGTHLVLSNLCDFPMAVASVQNRKSHSEANWLERASVLRKDYLSEEKIRLNSDNFNVYSVATLLSSVSAGKVFVLASSGYAEETFTRFFVPGSATRLFNGAALGAMGMGLPNAIGAAFGTQCPVMCIEADGGLMLNIQELATLRQYAPPGFVLYILNNDGYESIRSSQSRLFGSVYGADSESGLFIPDFKELAQVYRLDYFMIDNLADLRDFEAKRSLNAPPIVVDLRVEKSEYRGPSVKTVINAQGLPSTTPLMEINW